MSATADRSARRPALAALGQAGRDGRPWRSLDELDAGTAARAVETAFPALADRAGATLDRRTLLKLMGASLAMAGLTACGEAEQIVPYVRQPENVVPGRPRFFATTLPSDGYGIGALVESHEGRPTKVEGNPDHPASRGATDAVMQAAVLALFDPERSRTPLHQGRPAGYAAFLAAVADLRRQRAAGTRRGLALIVEPTTSPTAKAQIAGLRQALPGLRVFVHDPLGTSAPGAALEAASGRALVPVPRLERAGTLLSLDDDVLGEGPGRLAHARAFATGRRVRRPGDAMNRLYAVESTPTITGAAADHRKAVPPDGVAAVARGLLALVDGGAAPDGLPVAPDWLAVLADDLRQAGDRALAMAGPHQTPAVHAAALALNARLGATGRTVAYIAPPDALEADGELADFCAAAEAGAFDAAVVLDTNPVHTAPADLDVPAALAAVDLVVHSGLHVDETARHADWHVPAAHPLESWSDLRAYDGTASPVQPLIRPLFDGRTQHEILAALAGDFESGPRALVRATWADRDEPAWQAALKAGVLPDTAAAAVAPPAARLPDVGGAPPPAAGGGLALRFRADPFLRDGRNANLAWLQELPQPLTKLVWGNAALLSPATAARLGVDNGQMIAIAEGGRRIEAPVWTTPGQPDETVTLTLGHGRSHAGAVAALAAGYDAFRLRRTAAPWMARGAEVTPLGQTGRLITTQHHQAMEDRDVVRHATLAAFRDDPEVMHAGEPPPPDESLYPEWEYPHQAWGMAIDQTACIGCMACVAACQSENTIATVGPQESARGHEMHWLRIDRYYAGEPDDPLTLFQPVPCMHCEKAPCEPVCPVNATVHTHDGLNAQVYNRCIGTRYCSQNCPYKVRRFNFLDYQPFDPGEAGPQQAMRNPDVSVRSRGVMEKCTYCVQRISAARIDAKIDEREIADGAVVTACQQACPTQAITFGDLNDPQAAVVAEKNSPLDYALLAHLNTRPRTTYLGRLRNPNPRLAETGEGDGGHG